MGLREQAFNVSQLWPGILKFSPDDYRTDVDEDDLQEFYDHSTMCPPDYTEDFKEFALLGMNIGFQSHMMLTLLSLDFYMRLLKEVES